MKHYILYIILIQATKSNEKNSSSTVAKAPFSSTSTDRENRSSKTPPPIPRKPKRNTESIEESDSSSDVTSLVEKFGGGKKLDPTPKMFRKSYIGSVDPLNENEVKIFKELKNSGSTQNINKFIKEEKASLKGDKITGQLNKIKDTIKDNSEDKPLKKNIQDDVQSKKQFKDDQVEKTELEDKLSFTDEYMVESIKEKLNLVIKEYPYKYEDSDLNFLIKSAIAQNTEEGNVIKDDLDLSDEGVEDLFNKEVNLIVLKIAEILEKRYSNIHNGHTKADFIEDLEIHQSVNDNKPRIVKRSIFFNDKTGLSDSQIKNEETQPQNNVGNTNEPQKKFQQISAPEKNATSISAPQKNVISLSSLQKSTSQAPVQQKNTSQAPVQQKNTSQLSAHQNNVSSLGSPQKNTSQAPVQQKNTSQAPVQQKSTSQAPVQQKNTSQAPVQQKNTSQAPVQQKNTSQLSAPQKSLQQKSSPQKLIQQVSKPQKMLQQRNVRNVSTVSFSTKPTPKVLSKSQKIVKKAPSPTQTVNKKINSSMKKNTTQNQNLMSQKLISPSARALINDVDIFNVNNQKSNLKKMKLTSSYNLVLTSRTREPRFSS